jgi:glycosyltransferase involved in cell wall biosynthesis
MAEATDTAPAITVVIPCYNLGRFLGEAVESVLAQTMQDLEVIVVDDGSTDEATRRLLDDFNRPKTRLIRRANHGLAATRNHGIREGRGRYLCCLDADDRLRPEFFARAAAVFERMPEVGFVSGHFRLFGEIDELAVLGRVGGDVAVDACALPAMLVENRAVVPALFRRSAWTNVGGYCETFSASGFEDWDLWIGMLECGWQAHVLQELVWEYRIHGEQMSTRMYDPHVWGALVRELAARHRDSYEHHLLDVLAEHGARWATIRRWANDREQARAWWERESQRWLRMSDERSALVEERRAWITELEQGKAWLEEQLGVWRGRAEEAARTFEEQRAWIAELERGKAWLEEQRNLWQRRAEEAERLLGAREAADPGGTPRAVERR